HEVVALPRQEAQRLEAVGRLCHLEPAVLERRSNESTHRGGVLNDQNSNRHVACPLPEKPHHRIVSQRPITLKDHGQRSHVRTRRGVGPSVLAAPASAWKELTAHICRKVRGEKRRECRPHSLQGRGFPRL